jgi:hypothetical protein
VLAPAWTVLALPEDRLRTVRDRSVDEHGNQVTATIDEEGGAPLRCCLRDSRPGESLLLVAWSPFAVAGPYAEVGPVFVHAQACPGRPAPAGWPDDFRRRRQVLRAYRADGTIAGGTVLDAGEAPEPVVAKLLADPDVAFLHSRNIVFGCYMFEIRRRG